MKSTLILLSIFVLGILSGLSGYLPDFLTSENIGMIFLYFLLFFIGLGLGSDEKTLQEMKKTSLKVLLIPLGVILGTFIGSAVVSFFLPGLSFLESILVGSGFGYYSLSSVLITQMRGAELGVIALLANIIREMTTIFCAPYFVRFFGKLSPIASGGATSMDITLPVIQKYSGSNYVIISIVNGVFLSLLVPILVPILAGF